MTRPNTVIILISALVSLAPASARPIGSQAGAAQVSIEELWNEPEPGRDLYYGVGGNALAPNPLERFRIVEVKIRGASAGYAVQDPRGSEWSVKFPPEAFMEIVASRIHWAIGYHQPPIYLMRDWLADGTNDPNPQLPARFRQKKPNLYGLKSGDEWSLKDNPFVGTRPLAGLLVLQALIENPDIKPSNNTIYTLKTPAEGAARWYVVRDLGYSFGRAVFNGPKGHIEEFERAPFIRGVVNGKVKFHYGGLYRSLLDDITVEDVVWICERLSRLTDRQWRDAFRAGGYDPAIAERFIKRLKQRIEEGLNLPDLSASRDGGGR